jgi:hypothetical protein
MNFNECRLLPSSIIFGAMMVKIPSGDMVEVTDSGFTP